MASIEDLKGKLTSKNGIAAANQYRVELPRFGGASSRTLDVVCKEVNMPGKQTLTLDRQIGIFQEKIANGFAIEDVTMVFHVLNDYGVKKWFDSWQKTIVGDNEGGNIPLGFVGYKNEYAKSIKIHQLRKPIARFGFDLGPLDINFDAFGSTIYSVELLEAFPTTLTSIALSNDPDGLVEVSITFSYTKWKKVKDERSLLDLDLNINLGKYI
jgi:hypothetical protein